MTDGDLLTIPTPDPFTGWPLHSEAGPGTGEEPDGELSGLIRGERRIVRFLLSGDTYGAVLRREAGGARLALSSRERRVVRELVSGQFRKEIAHGLGVGASTVSMDVTAALGKLGLRRWEHLVLLSLLLGSSEGRHLTRMAGAAEHIYLESCLDPNLLGLLSPAEREVTLLVVAGNTNARIASLRSASVRTVANQVASVFQKLGAHGRLPLVRALGSGQAVTARRLPPQGEVGPSPLGLDGSGST
jgi:DNA-binding CsgD family transcriptional regulator